MVNKKGFFPDGSFHTSCCPYARKVVKEVGSRRARQRRERVVAKEIFFPILQV